MQNFIYLELYYGHSDHNRAIASDKAELHRKMLDEERRQRAALRRRMLIQRVRHDLGLFASKVVTRQAVKGHSISPVPDCTACTDP